MTNLVVRKNGIEVFRLDLNNFILSGKEITVTAREEKFIDISLMINEFYSITVENDLGNGITDRPAIYNSYFFAVTDSIIKQRDELGNIIQNEDGSDLETSVNVISSNQLLFTYL